MSSRCIFCSWSFFPGHPRETLRHSVRFASLGRCLSPSHSPLPSPPYITSFVAQAPHLVEAFALPSRSSASLARASAAFFWSSFSQPVLLATAVEYHSMTPLPTPATPNHALQRTAPGVTAHAPTAYAPAAFPHGLRRPPQSLSLGSFGDFSRFPGNDAARKAPAIRALLPAAALRSPDVPSLYRSQRSGSRSFDPLFPAGLSSIAVPPVATGRGFLRHLTSMPLPDASVLAFRSLTRLAQGPKTPNQALQRTAPGCHVGCSPQSPPRSRRASPKLSLSLRSLGVSSRLP